MFSTANVYVPTYRDIRFVFNLFVMLSPFCGLEEHTKSPHSKPTTQVPSDESRLSFLPTILLTHSQSSMSPHRIDFFCWNVSAHTCPTLLNRNAGGGGSTAQVSSCEFLLRLCRFGSACCKGLLPPLFRGRVQLDDLEWLLPVSYLHWFDI